MTFDWEAIDQAIDDASRKTDDALASRLSSMTSLNDQEIKQLFPTQGDVQAVAKLMAIVSATTAENERVNSLVSNIQQLAPVALRLLKLLA